MMKQIFRDFRKGENISFFATVLLVIITLIGRALHLISDSIINSLTLAMMGLVATGFLMLQYRISEILKVSRAADSASAIQLLNEFPPVVEDYFRNEDTIWMLGISLRKTMINHYEDFAFHVKNGLKIRAMLVNPNSRYINMNQVAKSYSRKDPPNVFFSEYDAILERYRSLREEALDQNNVQVGLLDFVPSFSLYIFPDAKNGGIIFVQIYAYKAPVGTAPYFVVNQKQNPIWYQQFRVLYEKMWNDSLALFPETRL
jgi:hypothetical protein